LSSIKKNFIYNTILSVTQVIFPLLVFPYLARIIQPEGLGIVSFVDSICRYLILLSALGIPIYGVREIAKIKNDHFRLSKLFSELVFLHLIFTLFFLIVYFVIVFTFDKFYSNINFYIAGSLMLLSNVFIVEWYYQGIEDFKFITLRNLIVRSILLVSVFLLVKNPNDSFIYFVITVVMSLTNAAINFTYAIKKNPFNLKVKISELKKHIKPLLFIFSSIIFISFYTLLDTILLGFLSNERSVGIYSMALKVARVPMMIIGTLGVVLIPKLAIFHNDNNTENFKKLIEKSISFVLTLSIPIIFLLSSCSREIILFFAGGSFIESQFVLILLSTLGLFIGISNVFGLQVLTPMSKDKYLTFSVLFGTIVSVGLNIILIPIYKEKGAAISNVLAEFTVMISTIYFSKKFIDIKLNYKFILLLFTISLPIFLIHYEISNLINSNFLIIFFTFSISFFYLLIAHIYLLKNPLVIEIRNKLTSYL